MFTLNHTDSSIYINDDQYAKNSVQVRYNEATEEVQILPYFGGVRYAGHYSAFSDTDGSPFESMAALRSYITLNFFFDSVSELDDTYGPSVQYGSTQTNAMYAPENLAYQRLREDLTAPFDRIIEKINIYVDRAGTVTFATGTIDQHYKFIQRDTVEIDVAAGLNSVSVNHLIKASEHLAILFPTNVGIGYNIMPPNGNNTNFYPIGSVGFHDNVNTFSYGFQAKRILSISPYVKRPELEPITDDINDLKGFVIAPYFRKPDGSRVKLVFEPDGSVTWQSAEKVYNRVLHLGNSMAWHSITENWWGLYGMAASAPENDYVHKFNAMLNEIFPGLESRVYNVADWEVAHVGFDYSTFDDQFTGFAPDLITFRLLENVSSITGLENSLGQYFDYLKAKAPTAEILVGGQFWRNDPKEAIIQAVCENQGLRYVPLYDLDTIENRSYMDAPVLGDDGLIHHVNHGGVAAHPGDGGHLGMATRMFNALGLG